MRTMELSETWQHSQKKRYLADRYANTNIMKPENLTGIEERAQSMLKKCLEATSSGGYADVYVSLTIL
jgi:hypothetical protein